MKEKECTKCKETKSLTEFYKRPQSKISHFSQCKKCVLKTQKTYDKKRNQDPTRKEYMRKWANKRWAENADYREWRKEYQQTPERLMKERIRWNTRCMIRSGELIKTPCEHCEEDDLSKVQAHHEVYTRSCEVKFLCINCHTRHHREKGA